jgi:uncharacterized damage-inducible protein DinB
VQKRLAEIVDYIEIARERLLDAAKGVNPSFAEIRPRRGSWCVAEILMHLAMTEELVARIISRSVSLGREQDVGPETSEESLLSSLDELSIAESAPLAAPERITPLRDATMEQAVGALETSRRALHDALRDADGMNLGALTRQHPVFGELTIYQWALFVGQHEERHTRQIQRTLRDVTERAAESAPIL